MQDIIDLASTNLLSPMVLFFALGMTAALLRSDLRMPEAVAKGLSLYLLAAIGLKGGVAVARGGVDLTLFTALLAGITLSAVLPLIAYAILRAASRLPRADAAAVAGHYGSISVVTFVAAVSVLILREVPHEGYMVAVAAAMEGPAIFAALWLAFRGGGQDGDGRLPADDRDGSLVGEVARNGSILLLLGAFLIGWVTGEAGLETVGPFFVEPFKGVLCLFLLDMGLVAGRGLRQSLGALSPGLFAFGIYMPLIGAAAGLAAGWAVGLSTGGVMLLMTLAASASYIAVPAAMRVALPGARPAIYLTLSLGVTFPFNLTLGIPIYLAAATAMLGT